MFTEADLAYIAAVIDVMGNIREMETDTGTLLPLVSVSCPDEALLAYLGEVSDVQAFVTVRRYDRHRCTEHCDEAHQHVESRSRRWTVSGAKATVILAAVEPYLRFQKDRVAEMVALGLDAPRKAATPRKMKRLGWPLPEGWDSEAPAAKQRGEQAPAAGGTRTRTGTRRTTGRTSRTGAGTEELAEQRRKSHGDSVPRTEQG